MSSCLVDRILTDELVRTRKIYKQASENAKKDYKRVKADKLRSDLVIHNAKKYWSLVNSDNNHFNVQSLNIDSFTTQFKE